ncbi:hypothetical protein QM480_04170 [Flectobacillus sp. DC10W]|uniref:Thymidylate synthase/dCMP hydroxymethylase domain-containing protein n=1 Tax=Flectobacillus longus TaxID=2984207 RepID=A0ABT6YIS9_9BACT|nr:hypothetical protein [Flectobacillus longus]MDI9863505.1 hypothetical protein [Flectobacillus longus]
MAHLIQSNNCLTAWRDACNFILQNGKGFNLVVQIENPLNYTDQQFSDITNSDITTPKKVADVSNTIFPSKLYLRNQSITLEQFYRKHESIYLRGKTMHSKNKSRWGNYFLRFTRFGELDQNQLQKIIKAINTRTKQYSACYIMHVSSIDLDSNTRALGNPCLQYVQFGLEGDTINLTAVYRNHDFANKALGNYIGLSKLLEFVCNQTGRNVGTFVCHSIHYYMDKHRDVQQLLNTLTW